MLAWCSLCETLHVCTSSTSMRNTNLNIFEHVNVVFRMITPFKKHTKTQLIHCSFPLCTQYECLMQFLVISLRTHATRPAQEAVWCELDVDTLCSLLNNTHNTTYSCNWLNRTVTILCSLLCVGAHLIRPAWYANFRETEYKDGVTHATNNKEMTRLRHYSRVNLVLRRWGARLCRLIINTSESNKW
jgi:hypothetical protein